MYSLQETQRTDIEIPKECKESELQEGNPHSAHAGGKDKDMIITFNLLSPKLFLFLIPPM